MTDNNKTPPNQQAIDDAQIAMFEKAFTEKAHTPPPITPAAPARTVHTIRSAGSRHRKAPPGGAILTSIFGNTYVPTQKSITQTGHVHTLGMNSDFPQGEKFVKLAQGIYSAFHTHGQSSIHYKGLKRSLEWELKQLGWTKKEYDTLREQLHDADYLRSNKIAVPFVEQAPTPAEENTSAAALPTPKPTQKRSETDKALTRIRRNIQTLNAPVAAANAMFDSSQRQPNFPPQLVKYIEQCPELKETVDWFIHGYTTSHQKSDYEAGFITALTNASIDPTEARSTMAQLCEEIRAAKKRMNMTNERTR